MITVVRLPEPPLLAPKSGARTEGGSMVGP